VIQDEAATRRCDWVSTHDSVRNAFLFHSFCLLIPMVFDRHVRQFRIFLYGYDMKLLMVKERKHVSAPMAEVTWYNYSHCLRSVHLCNITGDGLCPGGKCRRRGSDGGRLYLYEKVKCEHCLVNRHNTVPVTVGSTIAVCGGTPEVYVTVQTAHYYCSFLLLNSV
jgi:hypothetical protein